MAHIRCHKDGKWYDIETGKNTAGPVYKPGSLLLYGCPFPDIPLELGLAVTPDGEILFRHWEFCGRFGPTMKIDRCVGQVHMTSKMMGTLKGLLNGKIEFQGLRLAAEDVEREFCPAMEQAVVLLDAVFSSDYLMQVAT